MFFSGQISAAAASGTSAINCNAANMALIAVSSVTLHYRLDFQRILAFCLMSIRRTPIRLGDGRPCEGADIHTPDQETEYAIPFDDPYQREQRRRPEPAAHE